MSRIESLQDLTRFREESRSQMRLQRHTRAAIYVGMGTCGIAAGARETLAAIQDQLNRRQIDAHVGTVGCIGICAREPLVDIQLGGKSHVLYGNVSPEMVARLIEEHLLQGKPVKEWVICRLSNR